MRQGTVSVILGCHSPVHSVLVWKSWRYLYGKTPSFKETICIFLHDVGHWGLDYLDDEGQKKVHWELGACLARCLFGNSGYSLLAGHCHHSGHPQSRLYKPDKYSWYIAPYWWLWSNIVFEPQLQMGYKTKREAIEKFRAQVRASIETGEYRSTHSFFTERCQSALPGKEQS